MPKGIKGFQKGHKVYGGFQKGHRQSNTGRTHFKKGIIPHNKGKKLGFIPSSAFKKGHPKPKNAYKFLNGENHIGWRGDDVGYSGLHMWVKKWLGKPKRCEHCGKAGLTGRKIHWANIDHKYKRDLKDWLRLCADCHKKYDKKFNPKNPE